MNDDCVTPLTFISNCSKSTKTFKTRSPVFSQAFVDFSQFNLRYDELHNYLIFYLQCRTYFNTFFYIVDSISIILQGDKS